MQERNYNYVNIKSNKIFNVIITLRLSFFSHFSLLFYRTYANRNRLRYLIIVFVVLFLHHLSFTCRPYFCMILLLV